MSKFHIEAEPIELSGAAKSDLRTQFAALCYRQKAGKYQFCLITSRTSGRWIIPKGWPMDGKTAAEAAATEAYEEAGIEGKISELPIGLYSYNRQAGKHIVPCMGIVFPLKVKKAYADWPERKQRKRKWFSRKQAAARVSEPELRQIILHFGVEKS